MPRNPDFPVDRFDDLLGWLDSDPEVASSIYLSIRYSLLRIFAWNRCSDPEGMTDETFDRVSRQIPSLRHSFKGNPRLFFYGVANNLIREYRKKIKLHVPIEEIELPELPPQFLAEESSETRSECLTKCLQMLPENKRELVLSYYSKEKQAKIVHRAEMAHELGISIETLRVRVLRIRNALEDCIERCLDEARKNEMD